MAWWHWIVVGLILIALEMAASGGFYVIFFGIAAIAIGRPSCARSRRTALVPGSPLQRPLGWFIAVLPPPVHAVDATGPAGQ